MRMALAVALSIAVHAVLAVGLALCLCCDPNPRAFAQLDVSSVELSFAEREREMNPVAPFPPSPAVERSQMPDMSPPEPPPPEPITAAPGPDSLRISEPEQHMLKMEEVRTEMREEHKVAQQEAPRQAKVDAPPRPRRTIRPDYPKGSRQRGEQGDVMLEIRVDADGAVGSVEILETSGFAELDQAAVRAVRAARFAPAKSGRKSVASTARLKLTFKLR